MKKPHEMNELELKTLLNELADHITNKTGSIFILLLFEPNRKDHIAQYVSNGRRSDCIKAMKETIKRFEAGDYTLRK